MADKKKMSDKTDKRYRAKVTVGHDVNGDPIVKWVSGKTKRELEEAKREIKRTYIEGIEVQRGITFGKFAREWYAIHKEPGLSYSSRQTYSTVFNNHLMPEFEDRQMRAISANDLQAFMNARAGSCRSTIGTIHSCLQNIFKLAYSQGIIDRDPSVALKKPAAEQASRRALTDAEKAAVLGVGRTHPDGLLILMLYYTGLRLGEAVGLRWEDIDFKTRMLSVKRDVDLKAGCIGEVKTKHSLRDVPIPDELFDALLARRGIGYVFPTGGGHYKNASLNRLWLQLMKAVHDVDPSVETRSDGKTSILTAHYFRHNYASFLYEAGVDVLTAQRYLGHSKAQTTLDIYTHLSAGKQEKEAEKVRAAFKNF